MREKRKKKFPLTIRKCQKYIELESHNSYVSKSKRDNVRASSVLVGLRDFHHSFHGVQVKSVVVQQIDPWVPWRMAVLASEDDNDDVGNRYKSRDEGSISFHGITRKRAPKGLVGPGMGLSLVLGARRALWTVQTILEAEACNSENLTVQEEEGGEERQR
ncbi:uncharacterized protein LOC107268894 [Cephus cinctus]|uniref:Uncharacterized protein LOC107268894 n=1 Tax=Cephus cinctus TaxID=211228 RepID=A0AAJ7BYT0_CEPCN|nr:uncharacterized protein LOC107268894 [Cephus cinctus]